MRYKRFLKHKGFLGTDDKGSCFCSSHFLSSNHYLGAVSYTHLDVYKRQEIDWPESTKEMQRNWIGKSTGVEVKFQIVGGGEFSIFTTCIETIYGITFMVLAPDGDIVKGLMDRVENKEEVPAYIEDVYKRQYQACGLCGCISSYCGSLRVQGQ